MTPHLHLLPEVASKADAVADAIARHPSAHVPAAVHRHRVDEPTARRFIGEAQRRTSDGTTAARGHSRSTRNAKTAVGPTPIRPTTVSD